MVYNCLGCQRPFRERRGYSIHIRQCRPYLHAIKQRLERQIEVDIEPSNLTLAIDAGMILEAPDEVQEGIQEIFQVSTAKYLYCIEFTNRIVSENQHLYRSTGLQVFHSEKVGFPNDFVTRLHHAHHLHLNQLRSYLQIAHPHRLIKHQ